MSEATVGSATTSGFRTRRRSDAVEGEIVREFLRQTDRTRVLEIGTGTGRLTGIIRRLASEYVGVDISVDALRAVRGLSHSSTDRCPVALVRGDALRLPLASGSVTVAVLIRLLHRFEDPEQVLREVRRVVVRGGHLILSTNPRPSLGTLAFDLSNAVQGTRHRASVTFARRPSITIRSTHHPGHVTTRGTLAGAIDRAGFEVEKVWSSGLEEMPVVRWLPTNLVLRLAPLLGGRAPMPTDVLLLHGR